MKQQAGSRAQPGYLRPHDAANYLSIGRTTLWRLIANHPENGFPVPIKLSETITVLKRSELDAWMDGQRAPRASVLGESVAA